MRGASRARPRARSSATEPRAAARSRPPRQLDEGLLELGPLVSAGEHLHAGAREERKRIAQNRAVGQLQHVLVLVVLVVARRDRAGASETSLERRLEREAAAPVASQAQE